MVNKYIYILALLWIIGGFGTFLVAQSIKAFELKSRKSERECLKSKSSFEGDFID